MKRFILLAATMVSFLLIHSCSKGSQPEESGQGTHVENVDYFVKYVSNGLRNRYDASYQDVGKMVSLRDIAGESFERIVGPVSKGFRASFTIQSNYVSPSVRIEIKRGDDPFVVKAETVGTPAAGASVSYVIE